ncbi:MAG: TonB family protein [bacterium]
MDNKKSKSANLEDKKLTFILIGFVVVLSILYVAFEWTQKEITVYEIEDVAIELFEEELVEQTFREEPPPPPPPAEVPTVIENIVIVEDDVETEDIQISTEDDQEAVQLVVAPPPPPEEEELEEIFEVVEEKPEFPGGDQALMKYFANNVRYPVIAAENGIQGRVICQFTVWKDGSISDIKVVRGVDKSLDREAVRLIENMPKWKPGKQRGKAVACKFTVPVRFKLQ